MELSVEALCNLLARSRLLSADDVRALRQRWLHEAKDAVHDAGQFSNWLVANQYVTQYQAGLLLRGRADHFFLDQYKILDRIGKGRFAGVYKAVHHFGQVVAIKVLPPSKAKDAEIFGRFQREARMALRLKHPNVVRTFQTGEADGLHYIVMEYLEGETLAEVLERRGKLPPAEAVRLIYQALLGLQHIHEQGMVHRDMKPGNLMLVSGSDSPPDTSLQATVKILDVGLGRALFDEGAPSACPPPAGGREGWGALTNEGDILGTPDYLAPEQARDSHSADIRADIYSLGCVLYQALAGQSPFADTNLVRQLVRHATEPPRPIKELNPAVPDGLQQIVNWMLAKDASQRYPTPERGAQALQVFLVSGTDAPGSAGVRPEMQAYLNWLEASTSQAVPAPPLPRQSPPLLAPKLGEGKQARASPRSGEGKRGGTPAPPPAPPSSGSRRSPPSGSSPTATPPARPVPRPPRSPRWGEGRVGEFPPAEPADPSASDVELAPISLVEEEPAEKSSLSRRDYLLLAIGVGAGIAAAAAAAGIGLLVAKLLDKPTQDDRLLPEEPPPGEQRN